MQHLFTINMIQNSKKIGKISLSYSHI